MTDRPLTPEEERALRAAEHALGLPGASERPEAERQAGEDPAYAAEVRAWSERLAPLAEEAPEVAPPPGLWSRIHARLGSERPANDNARLVRIWRRAAFGASALAAASLAVTVFLLVRPAQPGAEVASLETEAGVPVATVAFDSRTGALLVSPGPELRTGGLTPHLWLVETDGGVRLVGAIDPVRAATHSLPAALSREAEAARGLLLSLEPAGARPLDRPAGPRVAQGAFEPL